MDSTRRRFVTGSIASAAALLVESCSRSQPQGSASTTGAESKGKVAEEKKPDEDVGPVEDLMREHGVLRRALIVYREAAIRLRRHSDVPPDALKKTALLFRVFGEDYHERKVEEAFVLPAVKRAGGPAGALADVLVAQHQRGREINDYVIAVTSAPKVGAKAEVLADVLESFARMYESHAAREDTIVFPAWKKTMSAKALDELGEKFEAIEHEQLGKNGFEDAVEQMAEIEGMLGLTDLGLLTARPPPKAP
jgi:hemerythrin-like domain-containing protein